MSEQEYVNAAHWIAGQAGVIPGSEGGPGSCKTAIHSAYAAACGREFHVKELSNCLPEDLGGYTTIRERPIGRKNVEVMTRILDEQFVRVRHIPSVILFDELTNTPEQVQAAALSIMATGIPGCQIFATFNAPDQATVGVELRPPMINRLCMLKWTPPANAAIEGWKNGLNFPAPIFPLLPDDWQVGFMEWGNLMSDFIRMYPDLMQTYPKDKDAECLPYPSIRSWTNGIRLMAASHSVPVPDTVHLELMKGVVGEAAATQFFTWLSELGLPKPDEILAMTMGQMKNLLDSVKTDALIAIIGSVIGAVRLNKTPDRWEKAVDFLCCVSDIRQELAVAGYGSLWPIKPQGHMPTKRKHNFTLSV